MIMLEFHFYDDFDDDKLFDERAKCLNALFDGVYVPSLQHPSVAIKRWKGIARIDAAPHFGY